MKDGCSSSWTVPLFRLKPSLPVPSLCGGFTYWWFVLAGLKPGQRKVLFTCLKRNDKREVKVAQLAGSVAEMSAYHHGEVPSTRCLGSL